MPARPRRSSPVRTLELRRTSASQKRRLLLARALYRDPLILILDEGTANLDAQLEAEICDLIDALPATRLIVAHRPALIDRAQRRIMLQGGRLI